MAALGETFRRRARPRREGKSAGFGPAVSFSFTLLVGLAVFLMDATAPEAWAANVPAGFTETVIPAPNGGNWNEAVGVTFSATGRMFVWERPGRIWFKDPGETNFTQLLDIREEVGDWGDAGCLGFAVDPNFQANGNLYLLYVVDRHHLLYYGTGTYNSNSNLYNQATIGRLTRYSCTASNNFRSVNLASRTVLIGESKTNGIPVCSYVHLVGSLVFGQDGTLLVSTGDGASPEATDLGGARLSSYAPQALTDKIIRAKEDVGAYRSQLIDCHDGKVLRLDPATGNGLPSNPFYDATRPRSAKSRVWTLGLRQPFRMSLRPNSGSHDPADGQPGVLYIGEVGWDHTESLKVVTGPGQNMGWPLFEGLDLTPTFSDGLTYNSDVYNQDAPNPLYPASGCSPYFSFRQLLKQDTSSAAGQPPFNNPCNASVKIPSSIPQFLYQRPVLDWSHTNAITRVPVYGVSGQAIATNIGVAGSPVSGTQFRGNCSVGGAWYSGTAFPAAYQNKYYHVDWGQGLIKSLVFTTNNQLVSVGDFVTAGGPIVSLVQHPTDGSFYYVTYNLGDAGTVRRLAYTGNRTPVAVAVADQYYGPGPLTVQFNGSGSSDPDGQSLTYAWDFGDGTVGSSLVNPAHVFSVPGAAPTNYLVTLTVTDSGGLGVNAKLNIALNATPPNVTITSPTNGAPYSMVSNTTFNLIASVTDAESPDNQLQYQWQSVLHHNDHDHVIGTSTNHASSTLFEPIGCDGVNSYYYRVILTVTDPQGLVTVREARLFPNCGTTNTPPTISDITNRTTTLNAATAPIPFTIGDAQVAAANLQLSGGSSNPALVPTNNIVFGGFGANRTVVVTPVSSLNGTATITVTVDDGPGSASDAFLLTVTGSNTPPTITNLTNQTMPEGTPTVTNSFRIGDANTAAGNLMLSGWAANPVLVPANNFIFGGSGSNRTVSVIPAAGRTGTTQITVAVSDGQLSASNSFNLTVTNLPPGTKSGTNATVIAVPDGVAGSPYPSTINISGLGGGVTNVTVNLKSLTHQWGRDLDILLVGPGGQKVMILSDAGTGPTAAGANFTFSDAAAGIPAPTGQLTGGTYKPTDYERGDIMPAPAPGGLAATNLSAFNGQIANGPWLLYVADDGPGDTGSIAGGWSLTVTTQSVASSNTPPTISSISNQVTLVNTATAALPFTIGDAEIASSNLVLAAFSSNTSLVPTNKIVFGGSGANRTVTVTPVSNLLGSATISLNVSDGTLVASNSFVLTVNPAALTINENSFSRRYGVTNPVLTGSMVGLQVGDNVTASFTTAATTNSPVGVYPIAVTLSDPGGQLDNYVITTNNGTLTVTNAVLVATADNKSRAYGQPNPAFTISYAGFVNGDGTNVLDGLPVASSPVTNTSAPGAYVIAVTGGGDNNYLVSRVNGTLTVTAPGPVTITAVEFVDANNLRIAGVGDANVSYKIQASSDLSGWTEIGTAAADGGGAFEYVDDAAGGFTARYYRIAMP